MIRIATLLAPVAVAGIFASAPAIHADPVAPAPQLASETMAQMNTCAARNEIVQKLSDQFKEAPQAVGVVDKSAVLEVFVSDAGTWTIIATGTDGNSCILSAGEGWQSTNFVAGRNA
ncbi:hypothetical protein [Tianweitania sediminis]|jgi:hypothetical protein|uniref:Uncharacterized protein n=1 Tax=Tianweitania sediminis TaxID=1502156 RepID=A0A8J7R552_9HYPH|nr:hypothetical protein [Tianweitania sediminis]MBP0437787.1 hypothetical protein [Tianweitania sediminis]HEV7415209.1 hypothetical protein [Tianweitania sediminis]